MRKLLILVLSCLLVHSGTYAQHLPEYNITATLNDKDRSLHGFLNVRYYNRSTDTLLYLWFNVYPNAFKTDRTAFSEYLLDKGITDFYFSSKEKKGYINRLDFRAEGNSLKVEDHPLYIDIIKVFLDKPLAPGKTITITTPFHVKLPYNFDGIGYDGQYRLRYWYPAVAAFIKPLTDADSSSNEPGNYSVRFTLSSKWNIVMGTAQQSDSIIKNNDSLKQITFTASNSTDVPINIYRHGYSSDNYNKKAAFHLNTQKLKKLVSRPILPAIGYNLYDGFQLGVLAHNFYKKEMLAYYVAPLYTFNSQSISGIGGISYKLAANKYFNELEAGITVSTFSYGDGVDTSGNTVFAKLFKAVPFVKITLPSKSPRIEKSVSFRSFIINEKDLEFVRYRVDSFFYPAEGEYVTRFVNELTVDYASKRVLYPYSARLQLQQGLTYYRVNATGNYFFNYPSFGGMSVRLFAAKFGYLGSLSSSDKLRTARYQPKLTAVRGPEDFTYSNYFIGRDAFDGLSSRQVMMRDGGLKLRTDLFQDLQGRSDSWIASINLTTTLPDIFPVRIPVKAFFDAGTHAEAWEEGNVNPRFLYVAGLQLSLFRNLVNVYAPVLYSKQIRDRFKAVPEENKFIKKVSFSLDIHRIDLRKVFD